MTRHAQLIDACRVPDSIPDGRSGLWEIRRMHLPHGSMVSAMARATNKAAASLGDRETYTLLARDTMATMHRGLGEVVMEDSPHELRKHLPILLTARGRVLVSGLGLGCVVRGLLTRPQVESIDVVEIDRDILDLVAASFAGESRVTIHHADALTIDWPAGTRWDFAWHDIWSDEDQAQPHLSVLHAQLLVRYEPMCGVQGAWEMPRVIKRRWPRRLLGAGRAA